MDNTNIVNGLDRTCHVNSSDLFQDVKMAGNDVSLLVEAQVS